MKARLREALRSGRDAAEAASALARWPTFSVTSFRMVRDLIRQGIRPTVVVDVGANRGQFTTAVLELMPASRVLALEPLPAGAAHLRTLRERYGPRLTVIEAAAGDTPGDATLSVNAHSQSSSLRRLTDTHLEAFPEATPTGTVTVPVRRLDDILTDEPLGPGSLLKVDVQGYEREVLLGAGDRLTEFEYIVIETSFSHLYEDEWTFVELLRFAESRGLRFVRPVGFLRAPGTGEFLQIDALFTGDGPQDP
jgi:FkbM family methyltransferase